MYSSPNLFGAILPPYIAWNHTWHGLTFLLHFVIRLHPSSALHTRKGSMVWDSCWPSIFQNMSLFPWSTLLLVMVISCIWSTFREVKEVGTNSHFCMIGLEIQIDCTIYYQLDNYVILIIIKSKVTRKIVHWITFVFFMLTNRLFY